MTFKKSILICGIIVACFAGYIIYAHIKTPTISVIMPTHNRAQTFLPKAIDSILEQTYTDFEFIIIDDGSTDNTRQILIDYQEKDPRIKLILNAQNEGLVASLNKGLSRAKGKYIARMDDDDISLPMRFEKQIRFLQNHPQIDLLGTNMEMISSEKRLPWPIFSETDADYVTAYALLQVSVSHPTWMMKNDFIQKNQIRYNPDYKNAEDRRFLLDVIQAKGKMANLPEVLYYYYYEPKERSTSYYEEMKDSAYKAYRYAVWMFFPDKQEYKTHLMYPTCLLLKDMVKVNAERSIVPQNGLERYMREECEKVKDDLLVFHPEWVNYLYQKGNKQLCHRYFNDCGTVEKRTSDSFTIKWDTGDLETFTQQPDGTYQLENP